MSVLINMHMFPQPIVAVRRNNLYKEVIGLSHRFCNIVHAVSAAFVLREGSFANTVETLVFWILN